MRNEEREDLATVLDDFGKNRERGTGNRERFGCRGICFLIVGSEQ
jgi:hypothetical protein